MATEEQQVPSEEAVLSVQLQETSHANAGASTIEGTTGNRENSKLPEVTSLVPMTNRRENQLSPPQVQEEEPRTQPEVTGNIGVVSPNLVNMVTRQSPNLVWLSQLQMRRERLFPEELLNRDGAWRPLRPYSLPGVRNPTANTPTNQHHLLENEENVESLQIVEYLQDVSGAGR